MLFGKSVVYWVMVAFLAICVFLLAQYLIPLLFGAVGFPVPGHIVNLLSVLIAFGVFWGGYSR